MLKRIILLFTAISMMALMMGASIVPAVAQSSNESPHTCVDADGDTICRNRVVTPSGNLNNQDHFRGDDFAHEGGAVVSTQKVPGEFVGHSTIAPSGNFNTINIQHP